MTGLEQELLVPLGKQGFWLATEFVALAPALAAALATEAITHEDPSGGELGQGQRS